MWIYEKFIKSIICDDKTEFSLIKYKQTPEQTFHLVLSFFVFRTKKKTGKVYRLLTLKSFYTLEEMFVLLYIYLVTLVTVVTSYCADYMLNCF